MKKMVKYAIPLGLFAFCWLTMRTVASYSDESMGSYGFPFPWYAPSEVSSMAYEVAIGPLVVDMISYIAISCALISLTMSKVVKPMKARWVGNAISIVLWLAAVGSLTFTSLALSLDPHFVNWAMDDYFGGNAKRVYSLQIGLGSRK